MEEVKTYEGSCHCGAVRYEVFMAPPAKAFAGNCSICKRAGWLLTFVRSQSFRLMSGEDVLRDYVFGPQSTHHYFCPTCGVRSFSRGQKKNGEEVFAINLRCIPTLDAIKLPTETFDCASL
jgi:hypothetical protein